jgi:predicted enzyme related to lactoylglutathione lyase
MLVSAVLYVRDLGRTQAFYSGCFNLEVVEEETDYAILGLEGWELSLVVVKDETSRQRKIGVPPLRRTEVPVKLSFLVPDIAAVRSVFEDLGGWIDAPSTAWVFRGSRRCDAVDPEGNVIQLHEIVGATSVV